jgi:hypothetical protein
MNVTIRDATGRIVASTSTGPARLVDYFPSLEALYCQTSFVGDVEVSDFYEVTVGRPGCLSLSHQDLRADGFHVSLTLGCVRQPRLRKTVSSDRPGGRQVAPPRSCKARSLARAPITMALANVRASDSPRPSAA